MPLFNNFFRNRKLRKLEKYADEQYLDAIEIIQESCEKYLELLAQARRDCDDETIKRLEKKLNANFNFHIKNWDGEIKISNIIESNCFIGFKEKRLLLE